MSGFLGAVSFLTRIPVPSRSAEVERSVPWFPFVGGLIGLVVAGVYVPASEVLPPFTAAALAVVAGVLVTGAFHEDGLADTADALGGSRNHARAFEILKDPRLGTFGALAIALGLLLRVSAIAELDVRMGWVVIVAAHALGRASALGLMGTLPVAADGLGAFYARSVSKVGLALGLFSGAAIGALALGVWVAAAVALSVVATSAVGWLSARRLGGLSGDILGACEQVVETVVLLLGAAIIWNDWPASGLL